MNNSRDVRVAIVNAFSNAINHCVLLNNGMSDQSQYGAGYDYWMDETKQVLLEFALDDLRTWKIGESATTNPVSAPSLGSKTPGARREPRGRQPAFQWAVPILLEGRRGRRRHRARSDPGPRLAARVVHGLPRCEPQYTPRASSRRSRRRRSL